MGGRQEQVPGEERPGAIVVHPPDVLSRRVDHAGADNGVRRLPNVEFRIVRAGRDDEGESSYEQQQLLFLQKR